MKSGRFRRSVAMVIAALALAIGAAAEQSPWSLRLHGALVSAWDYDAGLEAGREVSSRISQVSGGAAAGLGLEYRLSPRLGIEATGFVGGLSVESVGFEGGFGFGRTYTASETLRMLPLTLGVNLHLSDGPRHDLYVAPTVGYVAFSDSERFGVDSGTAFGITAGCDFLGRADGWSLHASVRYLEGTMTVDPTLLTFGLRRKF